MIILHSMTTKATKKQATKNKNLKKNILKKLLDLLFCCAILNTSKQARATIMKTFNFGSRFYFLSGAATVAALVGGSIVGALMIVGLVVVAYKY